MPSDVLIFTGGFKGVFHAFCASLMCECVYDELRPTGGVVLAPEGYYQSLRLMPPVFGGHLEVQPDLTGDVVTQWLSRTAGERGRAIYVPLVNNANGRVLGRKRAHGIARAVLEHNDTNSGNPVYVLGDDVYVGSYLATDLQPQPIGAVTGADLGNVHLGRMSDWTVSVVTPSKTFAFPTSRVAFAHTTNHQLRQALNHYRTVLSYGRVPQPDELTGVMALCATPQAWIDRWNVHYRAKLDFFRAELNSINDVLGFPAFRLDGPEGGWFMALQVSPKGFPREITSSVDAFAVLLHYGESRPDTGIAMLPGELFGYRFRDDPDGTFVLGGSLAVGYDELHEFSTRLRDMASCLRARPRIAGHALRTARAVADVDAILSHAAY